MTVIMMYTQAIVLTIKSLALIRQFVKCAPTQRDTCLCIGTNNALRNYNGGPDRFRSRTILLKHAYRPIHGADSQIS